MPSERWTRELSRIECNRRNWELDDKVGYYDARAKRTHDLHGFADGVAHDPFTVALFYIQWTSSSNMAARRKKMASNEWARFLARVAEGRVYVLLWGWRDDGTLREQQLTITPARKVIWK